MQSEEVFRKVFKESYDPLIRKIGKLKDFKISLDIPLSLLEQMDRYGYSDWISDVKEMVRIGKVELVGSAAYHPILSKLPENLIEQEIILNEYGLGYYLGDHQNLEGDPAVMVKNIVGFFPPELAINESVLSVLDALKYKWVIVDESAIPYEANYQRKHGVYRYKDYDVKIMARNRVFSNLLSFKRDTDIEDITNYLDSFKKNDNSFIVVLDGEYFGHHYDEGFIVLDKLVSYMRQAGIAVATVSDYLEGTSTNSLRALQDSSWGASEEDMAANNPYPMWDAPNNPIHKLQWDIVDEIVGLQSNDSAFSEIDDYAVLPIWDPQGLKRITNPVLKSKIAREVLLLKSLNSDQFWWASKESLPTGDYLYDPGMVKKGMQILEHLVGMYGDDDVGQKVSDKMASIQDLLNK